MSETIITKVDAYGPCACTGEIWLNVSGWPVVMNKEVAGVLGFEHGDIIEVVVRKSRKNIGKAKK